MRAFFLITTFACTSTATTRSHIDLLQSIAIRTRPVGNQSRDIAVRTMNRLTSFIVGGRERAEDTLLARTIRRVIGFAEIAPAQIQSTLDKFFMVFFPFFVYHKIFPIYHINGGEFVNHIYCKMISLVFKNIKISSEHTPKNPH